MPTQAELEREFDQRVMARAERVIRVARGENFPEKVEHLQLVKAELRKLRPIFVVAKQSNNANLWSRYTTAYTKIYAGFQREAGRTPRNDTQLAEWIDREVLPTLRDLQGISRGLANIARGAAGALGSTGDIVGLFASLGRFLPWVLLIGAGVYYLGPALRRFRR